MPKTDDFIQAARSYLTLPWLHQGRNRAGVDCVGLIIAAAADIGIEIGDSLGYRRTPDPERFVEHIKSVTDPATGSAPGVVALFRERQQPCHAGIFAEREGVLTLIHSYAPIGKVMEEPFIHHWPRLLMMTRRIKGLEY